MQLLHAEGKPNIFTSHTDDYWKVVRKGVAPAFSPKNIRCFTNFFGKLLRICAKVPALLSEWYSRFLSRWRSYL